LPVGTYTVECNDVSGFNKPSNESVTIYANQTTRITLDYEPSNGDEHQHTYEPDAGWYLVSVPISGASPAAFGTVLYSWNPGSGVYETSSVLEPSKGYWANLPANKTVEVTGTAPGSEVITAISSAGWHQIGVPWIYNKTAIQVIRGGETKSWADAVAAGWVRDQVYGYKAPDGAYTTPTALHPWYGYWLYANVSGLSLMLAGSVPPPPSGNSGELVLVPLDLPPMPEVRVTVADLTVGNYPNPVTDVHTTVFRVLGPMAGDVEEIRVNVMDLSGRLVWKASMAGAELTWHTDDLYGQYLANGVYLYQVQVKVFGSWVETGIQKLAILR
jgi:hypothetical protein